MTLLSVTGLTFRYGGAPAVQDLSFNVRAGEVLALIGPNGSGKTTTFNLIAGRLRPNEGTISLDGVPLNGLPPHRRCALGLARTFQLEEYFAEMTVLENVMVAAFLRHPHTGDARNAARSVLERTGLWREAETFVLNLPAAGRRRLEIARALATEPRVVLLDEATAGLRPTEVDEAIALIRTLREEGLTFVVTEHIMRVVMTLSDRIVVIHHGEKIAEGRPTEVARNPGVIDAYLGVAYAAGS